VDAEVLVHRIMLISWTVQEHPKIVTIHLNPVVVYPDGIGAEAAGVFDP
jgi:hypothetical protein